LQVDLVSAGMVAAVELAGDRALVGVELTTPACPSKDAIAAAVVAAVGKVPGVTAVDVRFSARVRGRPNRPDNPRLPGVKNIIAVAAGKGGVGKSTVSTNLAAALAQQGATVGILDADVYGPSIPQMMGEPERPSSVETGNKIVPAIHHGLRVVSIGFFVERGGAVIWRGPMVHKLLQQFIEDVEWGELDYLVVDLPPGTGDAQLSLSQLLPITGAVMVTTPQEVSVIDVEKALSMWQRVEVPVLGLVENMSGFVCPSCGHHEEIFLRGGGRKLAERAGIKFLGEVPLQGSISAAGDLGTPVVIRDPQSKFAEIFNDLARQVACALSVRDSAPKKLPVIRYATGDRRSPVSASRRGPRPGGHPAIPSALGARRGRGARAPSGPGSRRSDRRAIRGRPAPSTSRDGAPARPRPGAAVGAAARPAPAAGRQRPTRRGPRSSAAPASPSGPAASASRGVPAPSGRPPRNSGRPASRSCPAPRPSRAAVRPVLRAAAGAGRPARPGIPAPAAGARRPRGPDARVKSRAKPGPT
jgi:ATP-binding protein involved in chromosome partitioning